MLKEWADKWIEALESGNYVQGRGLLHTSKGGHCCLGVLCELTGVKRTVEPSVPRHGSIYYYGDSANLEKTCLPKSVMDLVGMRTSVGSYDSANTCGRLTELNDAGVTFERIAGIIRESWEDL